MAIVTRPELKRMYPGQSIVRTWNHPKEFKTAQTLCSDVGMNCPELNIKFQTTVNREAKTITIIAKRREGEI